MDLKPNNPLSPPIGPKVQITPEMMKNFKTLTCDCGGQLFHTGLVFKKISALVSPTGKEDLYPIEVLVCDACGKVPNETNHFDMLPKSVLAQKSEQESDWKEKLTKNKPAFSVQRNDESENLKAQLDKLNKQK